jgi:5-methyltetrahydropteroyltriglutamate--homocysteine methyltransferase
MSAPRPVAVKSPAAELQHLKDEAIRRIVKRQEDAGLKSVTDGEFRRRSWNMDFVCRIDGVISAGRADASVPRRKGDVKSAIEMPERESLPYRT